MRKTAILLTIFTLSCGWNPFPKPPPTEPPPDPPPAHTPECQALLDAGKPWCSDVDLQCGDCVHNPTANPQHCEMAPVCPEPPPTDPPPTEPTGPCVPETALVAVPGGAPDYNGEVFKATTYLGPMTGSTPSEKLDAVAEQLRKQLGQCVIRGKEAVFIIRDDGLWEENHTVSFGDAGWTNSGRGKWIGNHSSGEVPTGLLPDPREWDDYAKYSLTKHNGRWDRTLQLTRVLPYCQAIGMGMFNGLPRASCPVRPEGNPHREWWEREVYGAYWECDGVEIQPTSNPAQARCEGHVKTCDKARVICAEGDW